jgi:hypothetical protein
MSRELYTTPTVTMFKGQPILHLPVVKDGKVTDNLSFGRPKALAILRNIRSIVELVKDTPAVVPPVSTDSILDEADAALVEFDMKEKKQ